MGLKSEGHSHEILCPEFDLTTVIQISIYVIVYIFYSNNYNDFV